MRRIPRTFPNRNNRAARLLAKGPVYEDVWAGGRFDVDAVPSKMRERMRSELQDGRRGYIP